MRMQILVHVGFTDTILEPARHDVNLFQASKKSQTALSLIDFLDVLEKTTTRIVRGARSVSVSIPRGDVDYLNMFDIGHTSGVRFSKMLNPLEGIVLFEHRGRLEAEGISGRIKTSSAGLHGFAERDFLTGTRTILSEGAIVNWKDVTFKSELSAFHVDLEEGWVCGIRCGV